MSLRESRFWDKQLEGGLPDCRLSGSGDRARTEVFLRGKWWELVYCANCGDPYGGVTPEWSAHVFFICDDCVKVHGAPEGLVEIRQAEVDANTAREN